MRKKDTALQHAIKAAGGQAALAKALKITPQAINDWKRCPPRRVLQVEAATKGIVSRHRLRPDMYPA